MKVNQKTLVLAVVATLAVLGLASGLSAHPPVTIGVEYQFDGNPTCTAASEGLLPPDVLALINELKIDPPPSVEDGFAGVFCLNGDGDTILTEDPANECAPSPRMYVEQYVDDDLGNLMDWWGVNPNWTIVSAFVKGANGGNLYIYNPGIPGSPLGDPARSPDDAGLHALIAGGSGKYAALSHVSFCGVVNGSDFEGCTLGYWGATQGRTGAVIHQADWNLTNYTTSTTLANAGFTCAPRPNDTMLTALRYKGGPKINDKKNLLIKQAVAALLDASHPDVNYPLNVGDILNLVNGTCGGTLDEILAAQVLLNSLNNLGCPLGTRTSGDESITRSSTRTSSNGRGRKE